ncbi:hypothetical protein J2799_003643 [Chryseobacterium vietnamense]|nr:hypothetical protein [Chryseobacterium vietnamense]
MELNGTVYKEAVMINVTDKGYEKYKKYKYSICLSCL